MIESHRYNFGEKFNASFPPGISVPKEEDLTFIPSGGTAPPIGVEGGLLKDTDRFFKPYVTTIDGVKGTMVPHPDISFTCLFIPEKPVKENKGKIFVDEKSETTNNIDLNEVAQRWNDLYQNKENTVNELFHKLNDIIKQNDLESEEINSIEDIVEVFSTLCQRYKAMDFVINDATKRLQNWEELV